jgi:hypothetical protein
MTGPALVIYILALAMAVIGAVLWVASLISDTSRDRPAGQQNKVELVQETSETVVESRKAA